MLLLASGHTVRPRFAIHALFGFSKLSWSDPSIEIGELTNEIYEK